MTLRQKQGLILLIVVVSGILALLQLSLEWMVLALGLLLVAGILSLVWLRCPECGAWLGRYPGDYCKDCGAKIPWNEKKERKL